MAAKRKSGKAKSGRRPSTSSQRSQRALKGRAPEGHDWDPAAPEALAAAYPQEVREPRPYTSRYPIPNEKFEALKAKAPKAKLRKTVADQIRDSNDKEEVSARPMAAAPAALGLEPLAAPSRALSISRASRQPAGCRRIAPWRSARQHVLLSVNSSFGDS